MCNKGNIKATFKRSLLHLKNLKFFILIPIILLDVILPILFKMVYNTYGAEDFYIFANEIGMPIIPISTVLICLLSMKDYVGEIGVEILYVNKNRVKVWDFLLLLIYPLINVAIIAVIVGIIDPMTIPMFAAMALTSVFLFGLGYFLLYYLKSLTAVIMIELLYIVVSLILYASGRDFFPMYAKSSIYSDDLLPYYLPLAVIGIILCILGVIKNKKRCI